MRLPHYLVTHPRVHHTNGQQKEAAAGNKRVDNSTVGNGKNERRVQSGGQTMERTEDATTKY
jgi:hypothetical protein